MHFEQACILLKKNFIVDDIKITILYIFVHANPKRVTVNGSKYQKQVVNILQNNICFQYISLIY